MYDQAYEWDKILHEVGVRHHHLFPRLEAADFIGVLAHFKEGLDPYQTLANYLLYGAAAILGRDQQSSEAALGYHSRLNTKTKAVSLYFWAEEAVAHMQYQTAHGLIGPLLEAYPKDPDLNVIVATCCFYEQELGRGWAHLKAGLESAPHHEKLNSLLCRYHLGGGDLEAAGLAAEALLDIAPLDGVAFNTLSRVAPDHISATMLTRFETHVGNGGLNPVTSAGILFDLGRVYEAHGQFDKAFRAVTRANSHMQDIPQTGGDAFDPEREYEDFKSRADLFDQLDPCPLPTGVVPIFIVGLPRTGSTLLDQALSSHPNTIGLGEDDIIPRLVQEAEDLLQAGKTIEAQRKMRVWKARFVAHAMNRAPDQLKTKPSASQVRFVVDKMLGNSRHLGFLKKLFPEAVFINSQRNLLDVGLSVFFSPLHRSNTYATDLEAIGDYILLEHRVMAYWHRRGISPISVCYETLVDNFEPTLRDILSEIGMPWHDSCLDFHQLKRPVYTYSAHQVRRKLYTQSKGRWTHYQQQLAPLIDRLNSAEFEIDLIAPDASSFKPALVAANDADAAYY